MRFAHILSQFYFEPWNMRPDIHAAHGRVLQAEIAGQEVPEQIHVRQVRAAMPGRPIVGPTYSDGTPIVPQMETAGAVAVLPIIGTLGNRLARLDLMCGGVDYQHLADFAEMALADETIKTVILDIDSPGGSCRGLPECAEVFAALDAEKEVIAYTSGLCCSAAYYLACFAGALYASPSASVGNIGTILAALDNSREWEMKGWRLELFASGALKGIGFDGKQWTDTEREFFRGWMGKKFTEFQSVVETRRPQVAAECFDGRWLDGDISEAFGLTDGTMPNLTRLVAAAMTAN